LILGTALMTLSEISQFATALGVIASIIYAAIQIRNNARATRAAAYQHFMASFTTHWDELARSPELCSLMLRATDDFESLDRLEKARVQFGITALMRRWENVWNHHEDGTLNDADVPTTPFQEGICSTPGFWLIWDEIKIQSGNKFRNYIDSLVTRHKVDAANKPTDIRDVVAKRRPPTKGTSRSPVKNQARIHRTS
jgi:hypothetical protein